MQKKNYRGRFAPTPSGPLHSGSMVAAVASWLDAKVNQGLWLLRFDDADQPRCQVGAEDQILAQLKACGLQWHGAIIHQRHSKSLFDHQWQQLLASGQVYPCFCSRKQIRRQSYQGTAGWIYPGHCRHQSRAIQQQRIDQGQPHCWRLNVADQIIAFRDETFGTLHHHLAKEMGDPVLKRADGLYAYTLASVLDDCHQKITHVVRGADLLALTGVQCLLFDLLGHPRPIFCHLPLVLGNDGQKLSKSNQDQDLLGCQPSAILWQALQFLRQNPPLALRHQPVTDILPWAIDHWRPQQLQESSTV